ncbi:MAG: metal-dependent phosphohydrolase [Alphaproteobacteria bacterium]|jgi:[1-hydroxy-2-(trimethylamino)ethyl]phosphonate dioxygenase|nr:metal-dependent phosphohydrolase [Rhodospirillaceae bacterium]MBT6203726.1 metal-dependent phosphohydrolase [Rhodospirillaceae bacterium]MBT6510626.1 metal-dependent phosphohydrolase [Rhodospirillaceae bacterium]MBT7614642.1 metal-dependent phosphohydrolase [Rhodospirillaceae bacterium]MDG2480806.1 metal-dependent phosphohydrolase [Alphaproteobacteria bacterium]
MKKALLDGLTRDNVVDKLAALFEAIKDASYLGEPVAIGEHMLQGAACARRDGADDALVAAILLHDVGYYVDSDPGNDNESVADKRHDRAAPRVLEPFFPPAATEPIRLHVDAKRYLCAVEPSYYDRLSDASIHTMSLQGGIMSAEQAEAFAANPHCEDAVRLRRWDEEGKSPDAVVPGFEHYRVMLEALVAQHSDLSNR